MLQAGVVETNGHRGLCLPGYGANFQRHHHRQASKDTQDLPDQGVWTNNHGGRHLVAQSFLIIMPFMILSTDAMLCADKIIMIGEQSHRLRRQREDTSSVQVF